MKAVLDHVGIAVSDLQASLAFFKDVLGLHVEASEEIASQRVRATFLNTGQSTLEMLEATAPDSPIAKFVEKRGAGMHHVALRVDDIEAALAHLRSRGIRLIDEKPRPGAEGALVAFIHPSAAHGVLVELKQPAPKVELFTKGGRHTLGDLELITLVRRLHRPRRRRDVRRRAANAVGKAAAAGRCESHSARHAAADRPERQDHPAHRRRLRRQDGREAARRSTSSIAAITSIIRWPMPA